MITDERHASLQPVGCARCGATVLVAKFSPQHTSVQWTAAAAANCAEFRAEFRARAADGSLGRPIDGCGTLRDSIDAAVESGLLAVSAPSYERYARAEDSARPLPGTCGGGNPRDG
jgi:hypothetical protein